MLASGNTLSQFPTHGTLPGVYCGAPPGPVDINIDLHGETADSDSVVDEWDQVTRLAAAAERARERKIQVNDGADETSWNCSSKSSSQSSTEIRHSCTLISSSDEEEDDHDIGGDATALSVTENNRPQALARYQQAEEAAASVRVSTAVSPPPQEPMDPGIVRLVEMGFTNAQASAALRQHPGNPEGALMWLLNRARVAKEARQAKIAAAAAAAGVNETLSGTGQLTQQKAIAGHSFKAACGPVPRSPSVMNASPEPSRANRPCVMVHQDDSLDPLLQQKLARAADENTDPQLSAGDDDTSAQMRQLRLTGPTTTNYIPTWKK